MTEERRLNTADLVSGADAEARAADSAPVEESAPTATPLLPPEDSGRFRERWQSVQAGFVDEPRQSVEQADELVAEVMRRLAETFADERTTLEQQWDLGDEVSTEDLRVALQRYRDFFDRLLQA